MSDCENCKDLTERTRVHPVQHKDDPNRRGWICADCNRMLIADKRVLEEGEEPPV